MPLFIKQVKVDQMANQKLVDHIYSLIINLDVEHIQTQAIQITTILDYQAVQKSEH